MNPAAKRVTAHQTYQPQHNENDCDCPKHRLSPDALAVSPGPFFAALSATSTSVATYTYEVATCVFFLWAWPRSQHTWPREIQLRVAIQGEPGSNSHLAVLKMLGEHDLVPCALSAEVFESLSNGTSDAAVLPIENSLHGAVADHYDLLLEHDVSIVAESELRIRHALIAAPGVALNDVRRVLSHPVALSQCRRFFRNHPSCKAVPAYDTAGSVKQVIAMGDPDAAAIAAPFAAEVYGGTILQTGLEDNAENFTRFFHLVPNTGAKEEHTQRDRIQHDGIQKMSVAFTIPHRPGSLVDVLRSLAEAGADLTRIESRPVPGRPWEYVFFVDLRLNANATATVKGRLEEQCSMVKVLGRYTPAASALEA